MIVFPLESQVRLNFLQRTRERNHSYVFFRVIRELEERRGRGEQPCRFRIVSDDNDGLRNRLSLVSCGYYQISLDLFFRSMDSHHASAPGFLIIKKVHVTIGDTTSGLVPIDDRVFCGESILSNNTAAISMYSMLSLSGPFRTELGTQTIIRVDLWRSNIAAPTRKQDPNATRIDRPTERPTDRPVEATADQRPSVDCGIDRLQD